MSLQCLDLVLCIGTFIGTFDSSLGTTPAFIYILFKDKNTATGTATAPHDPLGADVLLRFDCLNRIIYSQYRRKARGEKNQTRLRPCENVFVFTATIKNPVLTVKRI